MEAGKFPENEQEARELVLSSPQFEVVDDMIYHVEADKTLRFVFPLNKRRKVFNQAHAGTFGGHLREAKIHSQLARRVALDEE